LLDKNSQSGFRIKIQWISCRRNNVARAQDHEFGGPHLHTKVAVLLHHPIAHNKRMFPNVAHVELLDHTSGHRRTITIQKAWPASLMRTARFCVRWTPFKNYVS